MDEDLTNECGVPVSKNWAGVQEAQGDVCKERRHHCDRDGDGEAIRRRLAVGNRDAART